MKNYIKYFFLIFTAFFSTSEIYAQQKPFFLKRYWNHLVHDTNDVSEPQILVYPTLGFSPETSWEIGLSSLYVFYAKRDTSNRLSEINGFTFYTLRNQFGIWFDHAIYSHKNRWFFLGRLRYQSFPILYHGIGPDSPEDFLAVVSANHIQLRERVMRRIYHNLYLGLELDFQSLSSVRFEKEAGTEFNLPAGSEGSSNLGLGAGIIYDTRHNVLNVRHGMFSELALIKYDNAWKSDYNFTSIFTDNRIFRSVNKRDVIAGQIIGQFTNGNPPFNQLAMLGGESIMRGYYYGRYRDRNLIAAQAEYRFLPIPFSFTKRVGAVIFASTGTVFSSLKNFDLNKFVVSGGGGIRYLLFPKKDIFTRLDVAFTKEGPGFYIFIGEAF